MTEHEPPPMNPLPWQSDVWAHFTQARRNDRLPHALLLAGPQGIGKHALANAMAALLLCEAADAHIACGQCRGCRLRAAGSHPDGRWLSPEEGGSGILRIEAIRELSEFSQRTSQFNAYRVAVVAPAEAMNRAAANALLKTLEEPPAGMCLILVSHQPARLPATVRSRCQTYRLGIPPRARARAWLEEMGSGQAERLLDLCGGAPLLATRLAEADALDAYLSLAGDLADVVSGRANPVTRAQAWQASGAAQLTTMMQRLVLQVARAQAVGRDDEVAPAITTLAQRIPATTLHALNARLLRLQAAAEQPLSKELSVEALFLLWRKPKAIQEVPESL